MKIELEIRIGKFTISRCSDESTVITKDSGEGAEFMNDAIEKAIEKFYEDNY